MSIRLLCIIVLFPFFGASQSITIGQGTFGGTNVYGPMYTTSLFDTAFSRHAYIYPSSVLTGLNHGDSISSIEFFAQLNVALTGSPEFKIYLKMVKSDTFPSGSLNWTNERNSAVLVYDGNPNSLINNSSGFVNFIFNNGKFRFDTTGGRTNLEILLAYNQLSRHPTNTFWLYESNFSVSAFKRNNEGKINYGKGFAPDTTRFSDLRKPHIRINFPRYNDNLEASKIYCLGKVPIAARIKDSVKVLIGNRGKRKVVNKKLYLEIMGANTHKDSLTIDSISPWQERVFSFGNFKPDSSGDDVIYVSLAGDDFNGNNRDTLMRKVNLNVFSHADPFQGNAGGIGFSGSTGDFVAKFFSDTGVYINQVAVDFSTSGNGFRIGIWDDDSITGFPGKVLFMSDSLTSVGGTYILPVLPRVKVGGGFYVGLRQNTFTNIGFSFQEEDPIRPGAFYFTVPLGNTAWVPFSPGFPFKFNIQPRIQVPNDVAPLSIVFPVLNQEIEYSAWDSIGPIATIYNYGDSNITTPFEVECTITNPFSVVVYNSVKKITLNAGQAKKVFFDTAFKLYNLGSHRVTIITRHASDKVTDNNTISQFFNVSVKHDLSVSNMFAPADLMVYEYRKDTIIPTVRINNLGTVSKNNFKLTFRIKNDTSVIYSQTLNRTLAGGQQEIISFPAFVPLTIGDFTAECFTSFKDSIPYNDTIRHQITIQKSDDVGPKRIDIPTSTGIYTMGGFFFPKVTLRNSGLKTQLIPFKTHLYVYNTKGVQIFYDTTSTQLGGFSETQITFKRFNIPLEFGKYKVLFRTELNGDQETSNDTLTGFFTVIPNRDIGIVKFLLPANDTVMAIETLPIKPQIKIKNYGSQTLLNAGPVIVKIFKSSNLVYEDSASVTGNLSYNSIVNITFNKGFLTTEFGEFTVNVFTRLSNDLIRANDTLAGKFTITRYYDLAISPNTNFIPGQVFEYENGFFAPQILVNNIGAKTYLEPFVVNLDLYKNGVYARSAIRNIDSLPKNKNITWFQDSLINLKEVGNYRLCATIKAKLDLNTSNDSTCWNFSVIKSYDLQLDSLTFPDKINFCYHNIIYKPKLKATNLGLLPISGCNVQLKIFQNNTIYWQNDLLINLNVGESQWVTFDNSLIPLTFNFTGTAVARGVGYLNNDKNKSNDTVIRQFNIAVTSGTNPTVSPEFKLYPNPGSGQLFIETPDNSKHNISVWNTSSQLVYHSQNQPSGRVIYIDFKEFNIKGGLYFVEIRNHSTQKQFKLIIY